MWKVYFREFSAVDLKRKRELTPSTSPQHYIGVQSYFVHKQDCSLATEKMSEKKEPFESYRYRIDCDPENVDTLELGEDESDDGDTNYSELFAGDTSRVLSVIDLSGPLVVESPFVDPFPQRTWGEKSTIDSTFRFSQTTGLRIKPEGVEPYNFFQLLVTDKFLEHVVEATNKQAEFLKRGRTPFFPTARISEWKPLTVPEFKIFLGLLFLTGNISQSRTNDYWSTVKHHEGIFRTPAFPENMARDRFLLILWCMHFATNVEEGEPNSDRLYEIRYVIDYFNDTMMDVYCPSKELAIGESNIPWQGRLKHEKYGMKLYSLTEPNGLAVKLLLYAGAAGSDFGVEGHANKVVIKLMSEFLNQGRSLYMDNYYNSIQLASVLKRHDTYITGMLHADRAGIPAEVKSAKLKHGEAIQRFSTDGICVLKWKDYRDILIVTTESDASLEVVSNRLGAMKERPRAIGVYNQNTQGTTNQLIAYPPLKRETLTWYSQLGVHIINVLLNNSYLLYNRSGDKKSKTLYDFRAQVISALLSADFPKPCSKIVAVTPPHFKRKVVTEHFPRQHKDSQQKGKVSRQTRCRYCQREEGTMKKTIWYCPACPGEPGLCHEPCFEKWHTAVFDEEQPK